MSDQNEQSEQPEAFDSSILADAAARVFQVPDSMRFTTRNPNMQQLPKQSVRRGINRTYSWCAAHRIEGHQKCGRLHGHNYIATVEVIGDISRDSGGMIIDFAELDAVIKPLIDAMDHRYLFADSNVFAGDPYLEIARTLGHAYYIPHTATTAECLAEYLAEEVNSALLHHRLPAAVYSVIVSETDRNTAVWSIV